MDMETRPVACITTNSLQIADVAKTKTIIIHRTVESAVPGATSLPGRYTSLALVITVSSLRLSRLFSLPAFDPCTLAGPLTSRLSNWRRTPPIARDESRTPVLKPPGPRIAGCAGE